MGRLRMKDLKAVYHDPLIIAVRATGETGSISSFNIIPPDLVDYAAYWTTKEVRIIDFGLKSRRMNFGPPLGSLDACYTVTHDGPPLRVLNSVTLGPRIDDKRQRRKAKIIEASHRDS